MKDTPRRGGSWAALFAQASALSFPGTAVWPGTHWILTSVSGLVFRIVWMLTMIWRQRCSPAVGCGLRHLRMAAWLSTKIKMVLMSVFCSVHYLAWLVAWRMPNSSAS